MPIFNNSSILKAEKKAADVYGITTQAMLAVLSNLSPQQKNLFECIVTSESYPAKTSGLSSSLAKRALKTVLDNSIFKFYVQKIDIPHVSLETTRYDNLQGVSDINYVDEITITFLETEECIVRNFLQNWMDLTFTRQSDGTYLFSDDQWAARKKMLIFPQGRTGFPNNVWFEIRGLRFKSREAITLDQSASDPMYITVTFMCDDAYTSSLAGKLGIKF